MQARYGILRVLLEVIECIVTLTVVGPHAGALWHPTSVTGGHRMHCYSDCCRPTCRRLQVLLEVIECIVTLTVVGPHAGALWHPTSVTGGHRMYCYSDCCRPTCRRSAMASYKCYWRS